MSEDVRRFKSGIILISAVCVSIVLNFRNLHRKHKKSLSVSPTAVLAGVLDLYLLTVYPIHVVYPLITTSSTALMISSGNVGRNYQLKPTVCLVAVLMSVTVVLMAFDTAAPSTVLSSIDPIIVAVLNLALSLFAVFGKVPFLFRGFASAVLLAASVLTTSLAGQAVIGPQRHTSSAATSLSIISSGAALAILTRRFIAKTLPSFSTEYAALSALFVSVGSSPLWSTSDASASDIVTAVLSVVSAVLLRFMTTHIAVRPDPIFTPQPLAVSTSARRKIIMNPAPPPMKPIDGPIPEDTFSHAEYEVAVPSTAPSSALSRADSFAGLVVEATGGLDAVVGGDMDFDEDELFQRIHSRLTQFE